MKTNELINHLVKGETLFNNGSMRTRKVTHYDGILVYYSSQNGRTITGILTENFAKWAKSTGMAKPKLLVMDDKNSIHNKDNTLNNKEL